MLAVNFWCPQKKQKTRKGAVDPWPDPWPEHGYKPDSWNLCVVACTFGLGNDNQAKFRSSSDLGLGLLSPQTGSDSPPWNGIWFDTKSFWVCLLFKGTPNDGGVPFGFPFKTANNSGILRSDTP